jgi:esterase FrsA
MAVYTITHHIRPYEEAKQNMLGRLRNGMFEFVDHATVVQVLDGLTSLDRDAWAAAFMEVARPYEERAIEEETRGNWETAKQNYLHAYGYYRLGRYPAPNSPGKRGSYLRCKENYLKAARWFDPPLERVEIPFQGRQGEGSHVVAYYRRPTTSERVPLLMRWGGIDGYKEETRADRYLERGIAVLAFDTAGTGEAPIAGSEDAERMWDAVFDWVAARPDLDSSRVAALGASTGGYWATKLAHVRRGLIRCAVNHGGCAHFAFTLEWIEKAQHGEYAYELAETLACAFGRSTFDEWVEYCPRLSLLSQGVLDQPCAPLLCVNGTKDTIFPIEDHYLLFEHGDPKCGFFPPVGHMGNTPRTQEAIIGWVTRQLGV